ncbi:MAG: hypothetical protein ACYC6F_19150 [Longimicrobiales bacterium]
MIIPRKYLDLDVSVLRVSAEILSLLGKSGTLPHDELRERAIGDLPDKARHSFSSALDLLFLVGLIDYADSADAVVLRSWSSDEAQ